MASELEFRECVEALDEANAEVERLRAEVAALKAERDNARHLRDLAINDIGRMHGEVKALKAERDALTRQVMPFVGDEHGGHLVGRDGTKWYPEGHFASARAAAIEEAARAVLAATKELREPSLRRDPKLQSDTALAYVLAADHVDAAIAASIRALAAK